LASCKKDDLDHTPHFKPLSESDLFADGSSARVPPVGTLARDAFVNVTSPRPPFTLSRIQKGRELFNIQCAVCHGEDGYGRGIVVRRGFPPPPSYHIDRLREAPDTHFFEVITNGLGSMYPFRARVAEEDRWSIVAYIRALQRSQHGSLDDVTDPAEKAVLEKERGPR
jgi:mono/diheme cytochrome c family protein